MSAAPRVKTAAALGIGNEILTGKVQETKLAQLAKELFRLGVELRRVVVCRDEPATIADEVNHLRRGHDWVVTCGGVGPTHDDVTIRAVALAFGADVVRSPELVARLRKLVGDQIWSEGLARMAEIPAGAELLSTDDVPWPSVLMGNVFVLPGLPRVFQLKMQLLRQRLAGDHPFLSRAIYTRCRETDLTALLDRVSAEHLQVSIGSYPVWNEARYRVKLTVDGRDPLSIDAAIDALLAGIPGDQLVPAPED